MAVSTIHGTQSLGKMFKITGSRLRFPPLPVEFQSSHNPSMNSWKLLATGCTEPSTGSSVAPVGSPRWMAVHGERRPT